MERISFIFLNNGPIAKKKEENRSDHADNLTNYAPPANTQFPKQRSAQHDYRNRNVICFCLFCKYVNECENNRGV